MIGFGPGKYVEDSAAVLKTLRRAAFRALRRLGFDVRKAAQSSLQEAEGPSRPGEPPHTHERFRPTKRGRTRKTKVLPASILYATEDDPERVIIGPSVNVAGTVGAAFEHEGDVTFRGHRYPDRRFMGPALGEEIGELPGLLIEELERG
jgi:hypothetical protein